MDRLLSSSFLNGVYGKETQRLCSNVLSCMLFQHEKRHKIHGIKISRRDPPISLLMYADDLLLFFKATPAECQNAQHILNEYANLSRQVINKQKSEHYFGPKTPRQFRKLLRGTFGVM